jgi:cytoskeleton protein RodZ
MDTRDRQTSTSAARTSEFALGDELRGERATKGKTLLDVQRDLRIQATYIAAIEDGDVSAFPNPSFVPGYIRSYARYLSLDPGEIYRRFCAEHGFSYAGSAAAGGNSTPTRDGDRREKSRSAKSSAAPVFQPRFPLSEPRQGLFSGIRLSAVGSLLVLLMLLGGLGYGGWIVLQNIQRVQFAPVEDLPLAQSEMQPIETPAASDAALAELGSPVAAEALADLYRQQELEVPILAPRDGPIAAINPDDIMPLHMRNPAPVSPPATGASKVLTPVVVAPLIEAVYSEESLLRTSGDAVGPVEGGPSAEESEVPLSIIAERAAWVRIYQESGTVLFERILEKGESYTPPKGIDAALIWAGNSGSVYVQLGDSLRGPIGSGTRAVRDISLSPTSVTAQFPVVDEIPEVISQRFGPGVAQPVPAVAIQ